MSSNDSSRNLMKLNPRWQHGIRMNRPTSLYLDVVRLIAALVVFLGHASGQRFTGGLFWQLTEYGAEAVTVFFVLSGFVISYSVSGRERDLKQYLLSRASRMYSVVIPALLLTFVADFIGTLISYRLYPPGIYSPSLWNYLRSVLFLNQVWWWCATPGTDVPFWSLGYEVWYYIVFAIFCFSVGARRLISIVICIAIIGPGILAMLPLWIFGVFAYKICERRMIGPRLGAAIFFGSLATWVIYEITSWHFGRFLFPPGSLWAAVSKRQQLPQDYLVATFFSAGLVGFYSMSSWLETYVVGRWAFIRWAAGASFSLYLFHFPLVLLFATLNPWSPASIAGRAIVIGGTLSAILLLAQVTERKKSEWRWALDSMLHFAYTLLPSTRKKHFRMRHSPSTLE